MGLEGWPSIIVLVFFLYGGWIRVLWLGDDSLMLSYYADNQWQYVTPAQDNQRQYIIGGYILGHMYEQNGQNDIRSSPMSCFSLTWY